MPGLVLSDLAGFSKPADSLINRIFELGEGVARPYQIKRVASAEVEAKKIHAEGDIEIQGLQQRAMQRLSFEALRNQQNIEKITAESIPLLNDDAKNMV